MENKTKCYCGHTDYCDCIPLEELKQETLEEAAKDFIENTMKFSFTSIDTKTQANRMFKCVEFGAKWQQEQDKNLYSEEDMHKLIYEYQEWLVLTLEPVKTFEEWFKQFKKK